MDIKELIEKNLKAQKLLAETITDFFDLNEEVIRQLHEQNDLLRGRIDETEN